MTDDLKAPERIWPKEDLGDGVMTDVDPMTVIAALESALSDMTQQRDAAMAGAVKVKPLVWEHDITTYYDRSSRTEKPSSEFWSADTILATSRYSIMRFVDDRVKRDTETHTLAIRGKELRIPTLEAAKAAAQADYNARVLSALTPDPDRMLALTAAAYEDAATITSRHKRYWEDAAADIRARIPADALAARSRIEAQAEARGMRICADIYYTRCCADDDGDDVYREMTASADATEAAAKGGV